MNGFVPYYIAIHLKRFFFFPATLYLSISIEDETQRIDLQTIVQKTQTLLIEKIII